MPFILVEELCCNHLSSTLSQSAFEVLILRFHNHDDGSCNKELFGGQREEEITHTIEPLLWRYSKVCPRKQADRTRRVRQYLGKQWGNHEFGAGLFSMNGQRQWHIDLQQALQQGAHFTLWHLGEHIWLFFRVQLKTLCHLLEGKVTIGHGERLLRSTGCMFDTTYSAC